MLTPTTPSARPIAAAPAVATMVEPSSAVSVSRRALSVPVPVPSTKACTLPAIRLTTPTPAPLIATPTPPAPTATDPASTVASIVAVLRAVSATSPDAVTVEPRMNAWTSAPRATRLTCFHCEASLYCSRRRSIEPDRAAPTNS